VLAWEELRARGELCDRLGIDSVWFMLPPRSRRTGYASPSRHRDRARGTKALIA